MPIPFTKYHGLGNDFVLVESSSEPLAPQLVQAICHRHFGVGADGILLVSPHPTEDAQMIVLNADGSRPEMCGNGLRCVAFHIASATTTYPSTLHLRIATDAGTKTCSVSLDPNDDTADVQIDLGPVTTPQRRVVVCQGQQLQLFTTSVGNPHAVLVDPDVGFDTVAPALAAHPDFPQQVNVGFLTTQSDSLRLRVWERGAGPTLACGTAACAAAAVAVHLQLAQHDAPIPIRLPGGTLTIQITTEGHAIMTGPARRVFEGTLLSSL